MRSITFDEATNKIAEHQDQFNTVHSQWNPEEQSINLCFAMDPEEIEEIARTRKIWYKQVIGRGHMRPMRISAFKEDLITKPEVITNINQIDQTTPEGKLLFAALAIITTESEKDSTPEEVLVKVNELSIGIQDHAKKQE